MGEDRNQLRDKVEQQQALLDQALHDSHSLGHPSEHLLALVNELRVLRDAVGSGWEHVDDATAARLGRWLEETRPLLARVREDARITRELATAPTLPMAKIGMNDG